jgi:hypothetical protein
LYIANASRDIKLKFKKIKKIIGVKEYEYCYDDDFFSPIEL